jgi:hypothetical protein
LASPSVTSTTQLLKLWSWSTVSAQMAALSSTCAGSATFTFLPIATAASSSQHAGSSCRMGRARSQVRWRKRETEDL